MVTRQCPQCQFILIGEDEAVAICPSCGADWPNAGPVGEMGPANAEPAAASPGSTSAAGPLLGRSWILLVFIAGALCGVAGMMLFGPAAGSVRPFPNAQSDKPPPAPQTAAALPADDIDPSKLRAIQDDALVKVQQAQRQQQHAEESLRSLSEIHAESLDMLRTTQAERDELAEELEWLKDELAAQSAGGQTAFVRRWQVLGPLDDAQMLAVRNTVERDPFRPGLEVDGLKGRTGWRLGESTEDRISLNRLCEHNAQGNCYLTSWVYLSAPRKVRLSLGSDDGFALWINRERVIEKRGLRAASPGQDRVDVELPAGWSQILANVDNSGGSDWAFYCELRDPATDAPLRLLANPQPPRPKRRDRAAGDHSDRT